MSDLSWLCEALDALDTQDTERLDRMGCRPAEGPRRGLWYASKEVATIFGLQWLNYHRRHSVVRAAMAIDFEARRAKKRRGRKKAASTIDPELAMRFYESMLDLRGLYRGLTTFCTEVSIDPQKLLAWVKPYVSEVGHGPGNEREMLGLDDDAQPLNLDLGYKTYSLFMEAWAAVLNQTTGGA